jgi:hypothetical protein
MYLGDNDQLAEGAKVEESSGVDDVERQHFNA